MEAVNAKVKILFVYLADPRLPKMAAEHDITELWQLVESLGQATVVDLIFQKGEEFNATYIGTGKVTEIGEYLKANPIDIIVLNGVVKPGQKFNLTKAYWPINPHIKVWDRVDLILAIFAKHAHTTESTLQTELARMRHMGPTIFGMGMVLSRQGGGVGTRGVGETNTELMKRHWRREIKRATDALDKITNNRQQQIQNRKNLGLSTVSLVGYTNVGKTSLFNTLTHKKNLVENALFATLDSTVGEIFIKELNKTIIISDTIGFIANLPPGLIDAFKSTLLETTHADIILHVIDVTDADMFEKIDIVSDILGQLKIPDEKVILVFNKIDSAPKIEQQLIAERSQPYPCVFISSQTNTGIEKLIRNISEKLPAYSIQSP